MTTDAALLDKRTHHYSDPTHTSANSYRGLPVHSKAGLWIHVAGLIESAIAPCATVLDLAAGSGALALKLADTGYKVRATDYVAESFRPSHIAFTRADLNTDFSTLYDECFDGIVAMEIIEHLENPRHFLREIRKLLRPSGKLFLTTPNVDSTVSKTTFLMCGHFAWFNDRQYETFGHITPVSIRTLTQAAKESGYEIERLSTYGSWEPMPKWSKLSLCTKVAGLIDQSPKYMRGDVLVAVLAAAHH